MQSYCVCIYAYILLCNNYKRIFMTVYVIFKQYVKWFQIWNLIVHVYHEFICVTIERQIYEIENKW